jgi:bifunctional non-homologous end joining protein LigD
MGATCVRPPFDERRAWLHAKLSVGAGIQLTQQVPTHGEALFREIARHDQEGIVAKRLDAPYRAGRQPTWLKVKNKEYSRREAVEWRGDDTRATTRVSLSSSAHRRFNVKRRAAASWRNVDGLQA